ncbi:hypothetical protein GGI12_002811, partial [Dipsacomyces acuminosporus]
HAAPHAIPPSDAMSYYQASLAQGASSSHHPRRVLERPWVKNAAPVGIPGTQSSGRDRDNRNAAHTPASQSDAGNSDELSESSSELSSSFEESSAYEQQSDDSIPMAALSLNTHSVAPHHAVSAKSKTSSDMRAKQSRTSASTSASSPVSAPQTISYTSSALSPGSARSFSRSRTKAIAKTLSIPEAADGDISDSDDDDDVPLSSISAGSIQSSAAKSAIRRTKSAALAAISKKSRKPKDSHRKAGRSKDQDQVMVKRGAPKSRSVLVRPSAQGIDSVKLHVPGLQKSASSAVIAKPPVSPMSGSIIYENDELGDGGGDDDISDEDAPLDVLKAELQSSARSISDFAYTSPVDAKSTSIQGGSLCSPASSVEQHPPSIELLRASSRVRRSLPKRKSKPAIPPSHADGDGRAQSHRSGLESSLPDVKDTDASASPTVPATHRNPSRHAKEEEEEERRKKNRSYLPTGTALPRIPAKTRSIHARAAVQYVALGNIVENTERAAEQGRGSDSNGEFDNGNDGDAGYERGASIGDAIPYAGNGAGESRPAAASFETALSSGGTLMGILREGPIELLTASTEHSGSKAVVERIVPEDYGDIDELLVDLDDIIGGSINALRIYVNDAQRYYTFALTEYTTCEMIIGDMKKSGIIDRQKDNWALFELVDYFGIERPLNHFENIMTVVEGWEPKSNNYIVLKGFSQQSALTVDGGVKPGDHAIQGMLYYRAKRNKWLKGVFRLQAHTMVHIKGGRGKPKETHYLTLANSDVYTPFQPLRGAPTRFVFGLKSEMPMQMFEKPDEDYVKWFAVPTLDGLCEWLQVLRLAKNQIKFREVLERRVMETSAAKNSDSSMPSKPLVDLHADRQGDDLDGLAKGARSMDFGTELADSINRIASNSKFDPSALVQAAEQGGIDVSDFKAVGACSGKRNEDIGKDEQAADDTFQPGSLLSKPSRRASEANASKNPDSDDLYAKGSLLSQHRESKAMAASRAMQNVMASNGNVFTHGSLLQVAKQTKPRPPHVGGAANVPVAQLPLVQLEQPEPEVGLLRNHSRSNRKQPLASGAAIGDYAAVHGLHYAAYAPPQEPVFGGLLANTQAQSNSQGHSHGQAQYPGY